MSSFFFLTSHLLISSHLVQAVYHNIKPASLQQQLELIHLSPEKAELFSQTWATAGPELVEKLKRNIFTSKKVSLINSKSLMVTWHQLKKKTHRTDHIRTDLLLGEFFQAVQTLLLKLTQAAAYIFKLFFCLWLAGRVPLQTAFLSEKRSNNVYTLRWSPGCCQTFRRLTCLFLTSCLSLPREFVKWKMVTAISSPEAICHCFDCEQTIYLCNSYSMQQACMFFHPVSLFNEIKGFVFGNL